MRAKSTIVVLSLLAAGLLAGARQDETKPSPPPLDQQAELEAKFKAMLTNAELVGHFTMEGDEPGADDDELREERYSITSVTKLGRDVWKFECRIQYGENDMTVPIPLKVLWAGDTPMVTLTDMRVAGAGPYTARVLFHDDKYAGTWSAGGDHGGHLFGRIERAAK